VQNKVSRDGYKSVYKAKNANALQSGDVQLVPFLVDAPPLTLGTLRSAVRVQLAGSKVEPALIEGAELVQPLCGCGPTGCVRTQGYWGSKPNLAWPGDWYREMNFYYSARSWQQMLETPARGSGYVILAQQFIAAVLNRNAGASAPQGVQDVMALARDWFASGVNIATCTPGTCADQKAWAAVLDIYNNGQYPGGPPHCAD
jgi:hypothetical protein